MNTLVLCDKVYEGMQRKAIVAGIDSSGVKLLSLDEVERSCDNSGSGCSTGCHCRVSGRPFRAALPKTLTISAGDTVEVMASTGQALGASLLIFGLPIIGGISGWFTAPRFLQYTGEWISAAGALAGILLAGTLLFLAGRLRQDKGLPEIVAVINDNAANGEVTS